MGASLNVAMSATFEMMRALREITYDQWVDNYAYTGTRASIERWGLHVFETGQPGEVYIVPKDGDLDRARRVARDALPISVHAVFFPSFRAMNDDLGARIDAVRARLK